MAVPEPRVPTGEWVGPRVCSVGAAMAALVGRRWGRVGLVVMVGLEGLVGFWGGLLVMVALVGLELLEDWKRLVGLVVLEGLGGLIGRWRSVMAVMAVLVGWVGWVGLVGERMAGLGVWAVSVGLTVRCGSGWLGLARPVVWGVTAGPGG